MTTRTLTPLLASLALLAAAAPAQAATKVASNVGHIQSTPRNPLQLSGNQVIAQSGRPFQTPTLTSYPLAGGKPKVLFSAPASGDNDLSLLFDVGEGRIAVNRGEFKDDALGSVVSNKILTGPVGGTLSPVPDVCEGRFVHSVRVSAQALAYSAVDCQITGFGYVGPGGAGKVTDWAGGGFDAAGSLIAYDPRGINGGFGANHLVLDTATGQELYRLEDRQVATFDRRLQPDGTLLAVSSNAQSGNRCDVKLGVATPQTKAIALLPVRACGGKVAMAGGRVVFLRQGGANFQLVSTDLAGGDQKMLANFDYPEQYLGVDTDGKNVVWNSDDCYDPAIWSAPLANPGAPATSPKAPCPMVITKSSRLRIARDGTVTVKVDCAKGCHDASLQFLDPTDRSRNFGTGFTQRVKAGKGVLTAKVPPSILKAIKAKGSKKFQVLVQWYSIPFGTAKYQTTLLAPKKRG